MSITTHELLSNINYEEVKKKREENFKVLNDSLKHINKLVIRQVEGPYVYPLFIENGREIRKKLAKKKIYIATLWPNVTDGYEAEMAQDILPIPCDQRYSSTDMKYIVQELLDLTHAR